MKKFIFSALLFFLLAACQQQKIGFVDTGKVINEYQKKIDLESKYENKDIEFKKKTDSIGQAFQKEAQNFQANASKMSQSKQQETYQGLMQKQQMLQQQFQSEQQQMSNEFQTEIDSLIAEVKDYVKEYGKNNGYSYVLGTSEATSSVLYGDEANDLTQIILDSLNSQYSSINN